MGKRESEHPPLKERDRGGVTWEIAFPTSVILPCLLIKKTMAGWGTVESTLFGIKISINNSVESICL